MENYHDEHEDHTLRTAMGFLAGIVIGGLAGAGPAHGRLSLFHRVHLL